MRSMNPAAAALFSAVVDYAGLFPPAALAMAEAVQAYARHLDDPARVMLGRFVVPVARLREFADAAQSRLPHGAGSTPWRLSALTGVDTTADIDLAQRFNARHGEDAEGGHAVIDALELKVTTAVEIEAAMSMMPTQLSSYFEIPIAADPVRLVDALARTGAFAKARTGGVTRDAFPHAADVARFMVRCRDAGVPFKLTAGLHHPLRGEYRLTYADDAPHGTMFGFVNALAAAMLAWRGHSEPDLVAVLESRDPALVSVDQDDVVVGGERFSARMIEEARLRTLHSFGSCSFREPADELPAVGLGDPSTATLSHL